MTEELRLHVVSTSDSRGLREAAKDVKALRGETDHLTGSFDRAEDEAFDLNVALRESRERAAALRREFAATGDLALIKKMRGERSLLGQLERVRKEIAAEGPSPTRVVSSIIPGPDVGSVRPRTALIGVLVGAVTGAAPTIGAILAGAVAGAIGTVGVAGGIAMASQDPRVQSAARQFGADISAEFFRGGEAFVGPTIRSLDILRDSFVGAKLPETFAKMAAHTETIAEGFGVMLLNAMPGINAAFARMAPFAAVAADGIASIGSAIGQFAHDVTASEGAVMGLKSFFDLLNGAIIVTGKGLRILSELYEGWITIQARAGQAMTGFGAALGPVGTGMRDLGRFIGVWNQGILDGVHGWTNVGRGIVGVTHLLGDYKVRADLAGASTTALSQAIKQSHDEWLNWSSAQVNAEEALDNIAEAIREHGRTLNVDTAAGRENIRNLGDFARDARAAALAKFDETQSVKAATDVYEGYRLRMRDTLTQLGFTRIEAQKLVDQWLAVEALPNLVKTVTVRFRGIGAGILAGAAFAAGDFTRPGGQPREFAHGGTTPAFEPFKVHRDETIWADRAHYVATAARTRALATRGAGTVNVNLRVAPGAAGDVERLLASLFTKYVTVDGADSLGLAPAS